MYLYNVEGTKEDPRAKTSATACFVLSHKLWQPKRGGGEKTWINLDPDWQKRLTVMYHYLGDFNPSVKGLLPASGTKKRKESEFRCGKRMRQDKMEYYCIRGGSFVCLGCPAGNTENCSRHQDKKCPPRIRLQGLGLGAKGEIGNSSSLMAETGS